MLFQESEDSSRQAKRLLHFRDAAAAVASGNRLPVESWSINEVISWAQRIGCTEATIESLKGQDMDGLACLETTTEELSRIGIVLKDRKKIVDQIRKQ